MTRRDRALIVSEDADLVRRWTAWLEQAEFDTAFCPGPLAAFECPRANGDSCPRREWADVAVVDVGQLARLGLSGIGAARSCTTLPDDGRTVVAMEGGTHHRHGRRRPTVTHPVEPDSLVGVLRATAHRHPSVALPPKAS
ncbi:MAG TPA: hypothetical protein VEO00_07110 [Actinomycetota bacterium]|nr:hypothetical protein [Actinomycetota bacterium]